MATSNAQRQAAYRAKHLKAEDGQGERLNLIVDAHAKAALKRLASCYGVTQAGMIERLVLAAETTAIDTAVNLPNGQADYYDSKLKFPVTA